MWGNCLGKPSLRPYTASHHIRPDTGTSITVQITTHIVIERPIREVFAFASNPCCWTEWIIDAAPVRHTWSAQLDVGTTFRQAAPVGSFWDDTSWEVTAYQPPRVFACRWMGASCGALRLCCELLGGRTRVTVSTEAAAGLFISGLDVERAIQGQMQRALTTLKHLLEGT